MKNKDDKLKKLYKWRVQQKVFPKMEFTVTKAKYRKFEYSHKHHEALVTDLTLEGGGSEIKKRFFDEDTYNYNVKGDVFKFKHIIEIEDPAQTINEILLELDGRGVFHSPSTLMEDQPDSDIEVVTPEDVAQQGYLIGDDFHRMDYFVWPKLVYVLYTQNLSMQHWVDLYQICFWLQRAFDLAYTLDEELDYIGPNIDDQLFNNVRFSTKEVPIECHGDFIEPSYAAATLGQLWEKYSTKYSLRTLAEYDYGTRQQLDDGRDVANAGHRRREYRKNSSMKKFVKSTYPDGLVDVMNTKVARRLISILKSEACPHYLEVFKENATIPNEKTLTNRIKTLKKNGDIA